MLTLEITIQRNKDKAWPVILTRSRTRDFMPIRTDASLSLDVDSFLQDTFSPEYGQTLGEAFFQGAIKDAFISALTSARADSETLRLLLFIEAEDLRELRWERLRAPIDGGWAALSGNQQVLFSQYLPSTTDRRFPPIGRRDLRALVLVAAPADLAGSYKLGEFDVAATVNGVKESLGEIPCTVLANTEGPENAPTLDNLCRCITAERYSILHIVCHGSYRSSDGETILFFPNETGRPVPATLLIERLEQLSGAKGLPHLAFLSTCESADPRAESGLGGLGHRLVRQLGMPVVVAMTDKVSIVTAQALASAFYTRLREHGEADRALAEATAGLLGRFDLTVPALFTRIGGKPIFSDSLDRPLTGREISFGLDTLATLLETRAPVLLKEFEGHARKIRSTLDADVEALSPQLQNERRQALEDINQVCVEVVEIAFNALSLGQRPPAYDARPPFRGLFPFRNDDKEFFFGREVLVEKLIRKVKENNFLAVLGPSGSGKSSLVLAGLIPALGQSSCYMTPNSDPISQMDVAMRAARPRSVLVVDQFEEVFTLCSDHYRREAFIQKLLELSKTQLVVVTMRADFWGEVAPYPDLRETMQNHSELVAPMNPTELRRAMDMQAAHVGLRFEADLSQDILDDVQDEPGAMPLLQHALLLLWQRRHGRWMRSEEYRQMGGIREAIARTADEVYETLDVNNRERMRDIFVRLTRLDTSGEAGSEGRDTRRRVGMAELIPAGSDPTETAKLVKRLADARIIVTSVNAATRQEEAEVAHEALIRYWPRLRSWLDEDRVSLRLREGIREAALEWGNGKRDVALLVHRGGRLEDAEVLSRQPRFSLNMIEQEYIKACIEHRENEKLAAERRRRRIVVAALIAGLLMMLLGCYGLVQANYANQNASTATYALGFAQLQADTAVAARSTSDANAVEARNQAATATVALGMAQQQAATALAAQNEALRQAGIATQALGVSDQQKATAQSAQGTSLVNAVNAQNQASNAQTQAANALTQAARATQAQGVAYQQAATATNAQGLALDQASTAQAAKATANAGATISAANAATAVSAQATALASDKLAKARALAAEALTKIGNQGNPDLAFLLAAEAYRRMDMYETRNSLLTVLQSLEEPAVNGFFNRPDSTTVSAQASPFALIGYRSSSQKSVFTKSAIKVITINSAGTILAAGQADGKIILWNIARREPIWVLPGHPGGVTALAFNPLPGSKILVSAGRDNKINSWDVNTYSMVGQFDFQDDGNLVTNSLIFSPDGMKLVANFEQSFDGGVWYIQNFGFEVLNPITLQRIVKVAGTDPFATSALAFSPDGKIVAQSTIVQAGVNPQNSIFLYDTETWSRVGEISVGTLYRYLTFSPDGKLLVGAFNSSGTYKNAKSGLTAWDVGNHSILWEFLATVSDFDAGEVFDLKFSPDGKNIFTAESYTQSGQSQMISLSAYDSSTGGWLYEMLGHTGHIRSITFTPDGKHIISGSDDTTLRIWELNAAPRLEKVIGPLNTEISKLLFSPVAPDRLVAIYKQTDIHVWNTSNLQDIGTITVPGGTVSSMVFAPDGILAVGASTGGQAQNSILFWNIDTLVQTGVITIPPDTKTYSDNFAANMVFTPDGQTLANVSINGAIYFWSVPGQSMFNEQYVWQAFRPYGAMAFKPDGKILAAIGCTAINSNYSCSSAKILFFEWNGTGWQVTSQSQNVPSELSALAYSPNGNYLAVPGVTSNSILLLDPNFLTQVGTPFLGHSNMISWIAFSPDNSMMASSVGWLEESILWDVTAHNPIGKPLYGTGSSINSDGTRFVTLHSTSTENNGVYEYTSTIHLWDIDPKSWVKLTCQVASRNFTQTEWSYYFPGEAYKSTCAQWPAGK